ncbi:uncharacterized protein LY89DRAFT_240525 [Mollisia scopiformis]|uniref:Transmembrane protein n=1 Tax=Mollisia scopiformis TaxID=149040 RepID=A0A194WTF1_MOLSC|nr:uncharacterized protein LY89DRAFT_240525 [Mollisia scopiformis]KUJ11241.1 hypothetical protein LY89DRAFT_240525 [Mollisia scopiformis]
MEYDCVEADVDEDWHRCCCGGDFEKDHCYWLLFVDFPIFLVHLLVMLPYIIWVP